MYSPPLLRNNPTNAFDLLWQSPSISSTTAAIVPPPDPPRHAYSWHRKGVALAREYVVIRSFSQVPRTWFQAHIFSHFLSHSLAFSLPQQIFTFLQISLWRVGVFIRHCICLRVCIYIYLWSCTHVCSADSLVVDFIMSAAGAFLLSLLSVKYLLSTKTVNLSNGNKESRPKFLSTSDASQSCQKMTFIRKANNIWRFTVLHFEVIGAEEKNLSCERKSGNHF